MIFFVVLFFIILSCFTIFHIKNINVANDDNIVQVAIYPTGKLEETYYFLLNIDDATLFVENGTRNSNDITQYPFMKSVTLSKKKQLTSMDVTFILNLVNKINEKNNIKHKVVKDSWDIQIYYKDKIIVQNCFIDTPHQISELLDKLIIISPIEVDLHGWS